MQEWVEGRSDILKPQTLEFRIPNPNRGGPHDFFPIRSLRIYIADLVVNSWVHGLMGLITIAIPTPLTTCQAGPV